MLARFIGGISAGVLIAIGGSVFLSCDNKVVGAVLFAVALLCICYKGYSLFTGKVGLMVEAHGKKEWSVLLLGLLGNAVATLLLGLAISYAIPALGDKAATLCNVKLDQEVGQALIRSAFCGMLMYLAVTIYREKNTIAGILFCVPVFILSGFEHSVANMFYFGVARIFTLEMALYILLIIFGNAIGAVSLAFLEKFGKEKVKKCKK